MTEHASLRQQLLIDGFHEIECGDWTFCFRGLVFFPGYEAGEDSLRALADRMATVPLARASAELKGVYGLVVIDRCSNSAAIVNDTFGLYKFFYDECTISASFKELVRRRGSAHCTVDDERIVEYLTHGSVYTERTFIEEIQKLRGDQVLQLARRPDGSWQTRIEDKALSERNLDASDEMERYFSHLGKALSGHKLSADITGGLDSRLNLAMLTTTGLDFELALSGRPGSVDVEIGRQVADVAGYPMFTSGHDLDNIEGALIDAFEHGDWQTDPLKFHRLIQFDRDRMSRGVDLICHGGGGELFKDFLWLQDFPLLGVGKPNFERFYALRVAPMSCRPVMSVEGAKLMDDVRERTLASFRALGDFDNVTGYLMAVIELRAVEFYGRSFSNHINLGIDILAPYLEKDTALAGVRLSIPARLMNAWHRKMIDANAPKIAEIQSTEGYAPMSGRRFAKEVPGYLGVLGRRIMRKSAQKLLGKNMFLEIGAAANDDKNLMIATRNTDLALESVAMLRQRRLYKSEARLSDLKDLHVGRTMAIGMFLDRLQALPANGVAKTDAAQLDG